MKTSVITSYSIHYTKLYDIELQDREFIAAIQEGREPNASVAQVLPAMQTLDLV